MQRDYHSGSNGHSGPTGHSETNGYTEANGHSDTNGHYNSKDDQRPARQPAMSTERQSGQELEEESNGAHESVLDAIREGDWTFEPEVVEESAFEDTEAIPGSREKIDIMADRVRQGLPIWHSSDKRDYGDAD